MFILAILIGVYSYLVFALGLAGGLYKPYILALTLEFAILIIFLLRTRKISLRLSKYSWILLLLLGVQFIINLIGALGPELGFDALWYHLTIPKIWLNAHRIFFIADGRYYYSAMPKLVEMLYLAGLSIGNEIVAKVIHLGFGLLTLSAIYKLSRRYLSPEFSLLACVIFYANLVVGWQSTTAYIDLGRTFFEILALCFLLEKNYLKSGFILGLAVSTKLLALGSLPIFLILISLQARTWKSLLQFTMTTILVPLPWIVFAYLSTGNPIYPIFSGYELSSVHKLSDFLFIFLRSPDPLSPIYIMLLPLIIYYRKKLPVTITLYCLFSLIIWWLLPRSGGGRFILPYLPAFSILGAIVIKELKDGVIKKIAISLVILVALISIFYRMLANAKFVPVILGMQSKQEFLDKNLDHNFGGNYFYWTDPLSK